MSAFISIMIVLAFMGISFVCAYYFDKFTDKGPSRYDPTEDPIVNELRLAREERAYERLMDSFKK